MINVSSREILLNPLKFKVKVSLVRKRSIDELKDALFTKRAI